MAEINQEVRGLYCRNGIWHMNKVVRGIRIYRSLKTSDYEVAVKRFQQQIDLTINHDVDEEWSAAVTAALNDARSWIHKTHARIAIRSRASGKGCTLTPADIAMMLYRSNGKCEVTQIRFSNEVPEGARIAPFKASIDRIESSKGYHPENCRVVCLAVNLAMSSWGEEVMVKIGKAMLLKEMGANLEKSRAQIPAEKTKGSALVTLTP